MADQHGATDNGNVSWTDIVNLDWKVQDRKTQAPKTIDEKIQLCQKLVVAKKKEHRMIVCVNTQMFKSMSNDLPQKKCIQFFQQLHQVLGLVVQKMFIH